MSQTWLLPGKGWWVGLERSVRLGVVFTTLLATAAFAASAPRVEAALSDHLTHQITEVQRIELQKQVDRAIEALRKGLAEGTEDAGKLRAALKQRATLYERANLPIKAEADLTSAIEVTPHDANAYADRAYFYMRHGRYPDALGDFVAGTRIDPKNPIFSYGAGRVLASLKNFNAAVDAYTRALELDPTDARRYLSRAEALIWLGRYEDARPDYERALALGLGGEEKLFALVGRGYCNLELGEYEKSIRDFTAALDIDPFYVNAAMWRGFAKEKSGERDGALADYERAAKRDPENLWIKASVRRLRDSR